MWKVAASLLNPSFIGLRVERLRANHKVLGTDGYIDDTIITAKLKLELVRDDRLKAREVNIETFKGRAQLSGFMGSALRGQLWLFRDGFQGAHRLLFGRKPSEAMSIYATHKRTGLISV
ncbi:MAG: hypothetical protein GPOALKHO_000511 [Sodalis sp.]|nr:MAG: hypothetical protein GPOALKHO_000511 [Sodalis sp.]